MKHFNHGGDLFEFQKLHPDTTQQWIDLSTGLNPTPYPWQLNIPQEELACSAHKLPQKRDHEECLVQWTKYLNAADSSEWLLIAGSQAFINITPRIFPDHNCLIVAPTYNEHERVWFNADRKYKLIKRDQLKVNLFTPNSLLIITNPNNPDGYTWDKSKLLEIASTLAKNNGILIVDEAFADLTPENSLASDNLPENIILLRSLGKFFGLAGLRLGIARLPNFIKQKTILEFGPWSVNALALKIAQYALQDKTWISNTRLNLKSNADNLSDILIKSGFHTMGKTDLFQLVEHRDFEYINNKLTQNGIYVRTFENDKKLMRFGLPKNEEEFLRLKETLV